MKTPAEKVLSYLTGSNDLATVSVDDLQKLVAENPYFPVTRFLLAKKLSEGNDPHKAEVEKAALYFSNLHWLQYQLNGESFQESNSIASDHIDARNRVNADNETYVLAAPDAQIETDVSREELIASNGLKKEALPETSVVEANNSINAIEEEDVTGVSKEDASEADKSVLNQAEEEAATIGRSTDEPSENFISGLDDNAATMHAPSAVAHRVAPAAETEKVEYQEEMAGVSDNTDQTTREFLKELAPASDGAPADQDDEHDKMFRNIKAMLDASAEEADAETKDAVIPIDPYYTIDYFASQGIKLELEQNPQDQLGQHLKKFTQWLKHMKKLGPEDATEVISRKDTDAHIQQIADSSNTVREVVTEAMALVLEKQGKKEKAIELYNKLSFLNPDKNAYFADKIKKLKGT